MFNYITFLAGALERTADNSCACRSHAARAYVACAGARSGSRLSPRALARLSVCVYVRSTWHYGARAHWHRHIHAMLRSPGIELSARRRRCRWRRRRRRRLVVNLCATAVEHERAERVCVFWQFVIILVQWTRGQSELVVGCFSLKSFNAISGSWFAIIVLVE